ncbi:Calpain catalytic domain-containing protein [Mycena sanguinolenta]|uniref:Calpain catalytic domain-containing protein n=1 Tax=Mycena sanguinolenta TaxID=230812 RepID=A0A8H7D6U2_9AGAR|nr:Calpain catalytic domain-containing protein [Mycena sanguinolenta]
MPSNFFKLFKLDTAVDPVAEPGLLLSFHEDIPPATVGLLSTPELETVLSECRSHVDRIAKQCKARNLRYRDIDFDIENDQDRCLNGLVVSDVFNPSDVQRVTELWDEPQFFAGPGGSRRNEIIQGQKCSNCWFISALAATSTVEGLVEKYCVARDEQVGVYGFVFWRDVRWHLLYTSVPKYEELSIAEKALFQNDKDRYNVSARKGNKTLYFAKSGTAGETWAPLVEKAYAKLHGDYGSLCSGYASEGVEDLTGGVSSFIQCKDILDKDKFWKEELLQANRDRVFSCSFQGLNPTRNGNFNATVNGLWGNHAYSILRTIEVSGRRFLVLRNPCGQAEWNGPWSDGSKEWTPEWVDTLPVMGHVFGDPGKFVMEYKDFLSCFEQVDRTRLFDSSFTMTYDVVRVTPRPFPHSGFGYGDLCFSFSISETAFTIVVLSQLDARYFKGIAPLCYWNFDFVLFKRGQREPLDASSHSRFTSRSVNLEFPALEKRRIYCPFPFSDKTNKDQWPQSKLARVISERATSESVVTSMWILVTYQTIFNRSFQTKQIFTRKNLPIPLGILAGQDFTDLRRKAHELKMKKRTATDHDADSGKDEDESSSKADTKVEDKSNSTTTITTITTVREPSRITTNTKEVVLFGVRPQERPPQDEDEAVQDDASSTDESRPASPSPPDRNLPPETGSPILGLKVYTSKDVSVSVKGESRHDMRTSFEGLTAADWNSFSLLRFNGLIHM